jgi:outer membrane protein assembly complex protein YaeT
MRAAACLAFAALTASCAGAPPEEAPPEPVIPSSWTFEGAEALSASDLAELVEPDRVRYAADPKPTMLEDAVFRLVSRYHLEGYLDVDVAYDASTPGKVVFRIVEGRFYELGVVGYRGLVAVRSRDLHDLEPTALPGTRVAFSTRLLARLRADILALYGRRGYVAAELSQPELKKDPERGVVDAIFRVKEGPLHRVTAIEGLGLEERAAVSELLGATYTSGTTEAVETRLTDRLRNGGHPFARVEATPRIEAATGEVVLTVQVEPGPEALTGPLRIVREGRTRKGYVEARAGLEPGRRYSAEELRLAEERLVGTGLFRSARLSPDAIDPADGRVAIRADLEEAEPGEVALKLGYGSLDGERIGADFSYDNLFGGAEYVRLGGTYGRFGHRADAEFALRYAWGTDFRPGVAGYYEQRDYPSYEAIAAGGQFSVAYEITRTLDASVGILRSDVRTTDVEPGVSPNDLLDFEYTALFTTVSWDRRDVAYLPKRGFFLGGRVEYAGEKLSEDLQFVNVSGRGALHVPLPWRLVASLGVQGGRIAPLGQTADIPISLRYFAGGFGTVRGFEFATIGPLVNGEPTGGELYLAGQAELRFPVWGLLHGAVFTDRGGVWRVLGDFDLDDTRWSVGGGVRLYTPAGAIVFDVGWNPSRLPGEDSVELHLSVGFPF